MERDGLQRTPETGENPGAHRPRLSRRQALGRLSTGAAAVTAAWVVPEILTAKPAAGATLSGLGNGGGGGSGGSTGGSDPGTGTGTGDPGNGATTNPASTTGSTSTNTNTGSTTAYDPGTTAKTTAATSLAQTGVDLSQEAGVGATLVAAGWALQRWASRSPQAATAAQAPVHEAGSAGDLT